MGTIPALTSKRLVVPKSYNETVRCCESRQKRWEGWQGRQQSQYRWPSMMIKYYGELVLFPLCTSYDHHSMMVKHNDWLWADLPIYLWAISTLSDVKVWVAQALATVKLKLQEKICYCPSHWMVLHWGGIILSHRSLLLAGFKLCDEEAIDPGTKEPLFLNSTFKSCEKKFPFTTERRLDTRLWKISLP